MKRRIEREALMSQGIGIRERPEISVVHLYISPGHNYFGHHGKPPGSHPLLEVREIRCVAGRGIVGDRFFDHKKDYTGQITFFEMEVFEELQEALGIQDRHPGVFRRNVVTKGLDLQQYIGRRFRLQGVWFEGAAECSPCYWMDQAFGPGAEEAMAQRGGLRARILTDGVLRAGYDA